MKKMHSQWSLYHRSPDEILAKMKYDKSGGMRHPNELLLDSPHAQAKPHIFGPRTLYRTALSFLIWPAAWHQSLYFSLSLFLNLFVKYVEIIVRISLPELLD